MRQSLDENRSCLQNLSGVFGMREMHGVVSKDDIGLRLNGGIKWGKILSEAYLNGFDFLFSSSPLLRSLWVTFFVPFVSFLVSLLVRSRMRQWLWKRRTLEQRPKKLNPRNQLLCRKKEVMIYSLRRS